jgi:hypothetical protein
VPVRSAAEAYRAIFKKNSNYEITSFFLPVNCGLFLKSNYSGMMWDYHIYSSDVMNAAAWRSAPAAYQ